MKNGGQPLLIVLICSLCLLLGIFIGRNTQDNSVTLKPNVETTPAYSEQIIEEYRLNINTATKIQLQELPGIGDVIAQRIIDYRKNHGAFQSVDELYNVEGIGDKKLQAIEEFIYVGG